MDKVTGVDLTCADMCQCLLNTILILLGISYSRTNTVAPACRVESQLILSTNLLVDLLEEGDLLLQALDASLQVQPGQCGVVHILEAITVSGSSE